jgi:hypothetical protein
MKIQIYNEELKFNILNVTTGINNKFRYNVFIYDKYDVVIYIDKPAQWTYSVSYSISSIPENLQQELFNLYDLSSI